MMYVYGVLSICFCLLNMFSYDVFVVVVVLVFLICINFLCIYVWLVFLGFEKLLFELFWIYLF